MPLMQAFHIQIIAMASVQQNELLIFIIF